MNAHAAAEIERKKRLDQALDELEVLEQKQPLFRPGYLEEIRPNAYRPAPPRRVAGDTKRTSRVNGRRHSR